MRRVLAGRRCAVVAIAAVVDDGVVVEVCGQPRNSRMTIFTDVVAIDVRRMFAGCIRAVVATGAIPHNSDVIERCRKPTDRGVAIVAIVAAVNMTDIFAVGNNTVMAGTAGANDLCVVNNNFWHEGDDVMAVLTDVRCLDMRIVLADRVRTVMATRTIANNIDVVKIRRKPAGSCMAVVAGNATGSVTEVFSGCC